MSKGNILIVEDEQIVALDLRNSLENLGYTIAGQADRGEDAVEKAEKLHPDLILMDIVLKGNTDGIQAAEQIRKQFKIPIIFLTAYSDEATLDRARLAEPFGYIVKPFDYRELVSNIEISMYKHQAEQARHDQLKQTELLNEIGRALAKLQDVHDMLEVIYQQVQRNLPLDVFFICLHNPETGTVSFPLVYDLGKRYEEPTRLLKNQTNTLKVIENAKPLLINRSTDELKKQTLGKFSVGDKNKPSASLLFAPLIIGEQVTGVLSIQSYKLNTYTEQHLDFLSGVACFASVAIENSRLFTSLQHELIERKKVEDALRENENKFRSVVEKASDGIVLIDFKGTVSEWNKSAEKIIGINRTDVIGQPIWDVVYQMMPKEKRTAEFQKVNADIWLAEVKNGYANKDSNAEYEIETPQGVRRNIQSNGFNFETTQGWMGGVILRDITERKKIEIELRNKNTELEKFTYTVSHDLKAPLFSIRGFLGYLEKDIASGNADRIKSDLERIDTSTKKMQNLLTNLLDLSRTGRLTNPYQLVLFEDLVQDAIDAVTGRITTRGVQIEISPNLPSIFCDRTRITQVLQNLIDNAVKFMGDQPHPHIQVGKRESGKDFAFFVRDNGIGITPEYQNKVFGLFDKLDSSAEGTGIGLALVKRIIESHGGKIWVESEGIDKGSTFCFTIPDNMI